MSWVEERMGNEDTDKELSQMLLLGRSSFWGMLPRRLRWEKVAIRRASGTCRDGRLGPEGVEGEELGLGQSEGGPLEAGGFRRGPAETQALWAGGKQRGCGPMAALSPVV